ncbi:MAG: type III pantothenate kinase [Bacteroidota bacterium]
MNLRKKHVAPNVLSIDIGNTLTKLALMEKGKVLEVQTCTLEQLEEHIAAILNQHGNSLKACSWINVNEQLDISTLVCWKAYPQISLLPINHQTDFPIENLYATPHTLGADRIVAVIGAQSLIKQGAVLVIDAGTAITYDYANALSQYQGGGIAPGMSMRFRALHEFTARLPLIEASEDLPLVGQSTAASIRSGVQNGVLAEVNGIIQQYENQQNGEFFVFLTGGDAAFFEKRLKNINFASSNLIHFGIYRILSHLKLT